MGRVPLSIRRAVAFGICLAVGACGSGARETAECEPLAVVDGLTDSRMYDVFALASDGGLDQLTDDRHSFDPAVAPDGTWIVYTRGGEGTHEECCGYSETSLRTMDANGEAIAEFPTEPGWNDGRAAVAPDGESVAFIRRERRGTGAKVVVSDRAGRNTKVLVDLDDESGALDWSPDGNTIAVTVSMPSALLLVDVRDGTTTRVNSGTEGRADWAPKGDRIVVSGGGYESGSPPQVIDVPSGDATVLRPPAGSNWTNASYASDGLHVLRFEQTVELVPQRLELITESGDILDSNDVEVRAMSGGSGRVLIGGFSRSSCF